MEKIFLEKNRNITSLNKENNVNVNLEQKPRLLPHNDIRDTFNLFELYNDERDSCGKYRLMFTINPICTNVLHNMKTEVVYKEGSDDCKNILDTNKYHIPQVSPTPCNTKTDIGQKDAVRNTEYSHPSLGGLVYHCGVDIFNNHMLRNDGFVHVNKMNSTSKSICGSVYNTIEDFQRDSYGNLVKETLNTSTSKDTINMHQYSLDNILTMETAYEERCEEQDGWFGFTNRSNIDIPNRDALEDNTIKINKIMNNNKSCEFYDMYPDRSLYSFIPKVNKYRNRIERNWDYCITYPYYSDYEKFKEVSGKNNMIRCDYMLTTGGNGHEIYVFRSFIKHNLVYGETIRLQHSGETTAYTDINIDGTGDVNSEDTEHYFKIYKNNIVNFIGTGTTAGTIFFKKVVNESGCQYYFRRFKKLTKEDGTQYNSTIGKLAYGENIYGDRTAEIIFTDDIDVSGIMDNRNRDLTSIYLTVVKANRGNKLWYEDKAYEDSRVEYSHCFGKITSGLLTQSAETDYNIRKLQNFDISVVTSSTYSAGTRAMFTGLTCYNTLENDIKLKEKDWFYGDIVELNPSTNKETILEKVYHRFNTYQRENYLEDYADIYYDQLIGDDYDEGVKINNKELNGFTVSGVTCNIYNGNKFLGNIQPEGYFYSPHYEIKIRENSDAINEQLGVYIEQPTGVTPTAITPYGDITIVEITAKTDYDYVSGDVFAFYKDETLLWGYLDRFEYLLDGIKLRIEVHGNIDSLVGWDILLTDGSVPEYASYIQSEQKFVWNDVLLLSELSSDSELKEIMFTNGRLYLHKNITFPLMRQDPNGENNLLIPVRDKNGKDISPLKNYKPKGMIIDLSFYKYLAIEIGNSCL